MAKKTAKRAASGPRRRRKRPITPDDLRELVLVASPQIAPNGASIVFVRKHVGPRNEFVSDLWMVATDEGEPRRFTAGERDSQPRWSPDGKTIAFVRAQPKRIPQIWTIPAAGGEACRLTDFPEGTIASFKWSPDARRLAVSFREQDPEWTEAAEKERRRHGLSDPPRVLDHWWYRLDGDGYFGAQRFALHVVDVDSGARRRLYARDTLGFFSYDFSPDGRQLAVTTQRHPRAGLRAWNDEMLRIRVSTGRITPVRDLPEGPKDAVAWSPDGKWIAFAGRRGGDSTYSTENLELWVCDPVKGRARCLTGREDYCLLATALTDVSEARFEPTIGWSRDSRRIFMQLGWHGEAHLASVRRAGGDVTLHTSGARAHTVGNVSTDGRRMAMIVDSATTPPEVHVADLSEPAARVTPLTTFNRPLMREREVARPKSHWIRTADGTRVQVWVMLPPGARPTRRCPAALEIHGGPHALYGTGFFHEFQVLAAAGYAVFYSNPRGSKGYGRDHCAAIRGKWGTADWTDIQAVTAFMKSHPNVDPKRMGVMGGSYGGYMTNWVIGHTREFAAAITDRCVSNVVSMAGTSDFLDEPDRYFPGNHWDRTEERWRASPIRYIGNARTPTLIIHSEGDLRCNVEQAEQVYTALTVLKVPTRFVRYPRSTSHGLSRGGPPDLRIHRLNQILAWWKKYL